MAKFYNTKSFKKLNKTWKNKLAKLAKDGKGGKDGVFEDIEDKSENLKTYDRRTIAFDNRDLIQDFFLKLDTYLTNTPDIPDMDRRVLELYTKGTHIKGKGGIVEQIDKSETFIRLIIKRYKTLLS